LLNLGLPAILALAVILLVAFPIHEAAHAWMAYRLGDDTARRMGRLSLNPLAHLDPLGSIMLLVAGIGWAKPVPVNPYNLRYGPRVGNALVAGAGPLSNLLMAALVAIPWRFGVFEGGPLWVRTAATMFVALNVLLCVFNLIPLAPLDGNSVLYGIVGQTGAAILAPLRTFGPMILMGLLAIGLIVPGANILGRILYPAMNAILRLLLGA
jgi:Zn-dependent protease